MDRRRGALAGRAVQLQGGAVQFHQGHGQRQAESHTLVVSRVAACDLTEGRNRLGHVLFGDADAGVRDREDQRPVAVNSRRYRDFAAFGGELDGVADEVEQNLLDLGLVGAKRRRPPMMV